MPGAQQHERFSHHSHIFFLMSLCLGLRKSFSRLLGKLIDYRVSGHTFCVRGRAGRRNGESVSYLKDTRLGHERRKVCTCMRVSRVLLFNDAPVYLLPCTVR